MAMRSLIYSMMVSLDGYVETPYREIDWTIPDEELARLKEQPGKDLLLGGATIAASFMELGLVDEYRLFVHPVVLGAGTPFFPVLNTRLELALVETRTFGSGVVYLRYVRRR